MAGSVRQHPSSLTPWARRGHHAGFLAPLAGQPAAAYSSCRPWRAGSCQTASSHQLKHHQALRVAAAHARLLNWPRALPTAARSDAPAQSPTPWRGSARGGPRSAGCGANPSRQPASPRGQTSLPRLATMGVCVSRSKLWRCHACCCNANAAAAPRAAAPYVRHALAPRAEAARGQANGATSRLASKRAKQVPRW